MRVTVTSLGSTPWALSSSLIYVGGGGGRNEVPQSGPRAIVFPLRSAADFIGESGATMTWLQPKFIPSTM